MFNFLKNKEDAPPDVGQEDAYEEKKKKAKGKKEEDSQNEKESREESLENDNEPKIAESIKTRNFKKLKNRESDEINSFNEMNNLEFEKINVRIESISSLLKGMNERFSGINQQIGELRAMSLANEKSISKGMQDAFKAIDIVREVKPDKLRIDYQKLDLKLNTFSEKLEAKRQFEEVMMNELKDLRKKAGIFIGTDALLKLNEEVKKDLIELQKLSSRVRFNTDKSEQIFIELKKGFAENQKLNEMVNNFDSSYSGLKKEVEKLKLDYSSIIKQDELGDLKKELDKRFIAVESSIADIGSIKENNERMTMLIEKTLSIAKRNREDIADIAITIGDDKIKRVSDYEEELTSILRIIDSVAGQISEIKKKIGMDSSGKINVRHDNKKIINKKQLHFKNLDVHPKISKPLVSKEPEISENIKKIQDSKTDEKTKENRETDNLLKSLRKNKE